MRLAAEYGNMDWVKAKQEFDAAKASAGEAVHMKACDRCHSDAGTNPDDEASMLGGQQMGYLRTTFEQYAAGTREQPKKDEGSASTRCPRTRSKRSFTTTAAFNEFCERRR